MDNMGFKLNEWVESPNAVRKSTSIGFKQGPYPVGSASLGDLGWHMIGKVLCRMTMIEQ